MSLLFLEPIGGIAGDMFLAACLDLGVAQEALEAALATLGVAGFRLEVKKVELSSIVGTHLAVVVEGPQPGERHLSEIHELIEKSGLSARAREAARAVFDAIGRAEAKVHGIPLERVHFHEVGAVDSIVDICGAAVALELLGWPRLVSMPPQLGQGTAKMAHGAMPIPPPATLEILRGKTIRMGGPPGEAVTPTGAGLLAALCEVGEAPAFAPSRVGYGVGTARWPDRPNVLRATLGEEAKARAAGELVVMEANLDDCPGQLVARAIEAALERGALDAWAAPLTMKKGRTGILFGAIVPAAAKDAVARAILAETTTLGLRFHAVDRIELDRSFVPVATPFGEVRVKVGRLEGKELSAHPEYEECARLAREQGVAVKEVMQAALAAYLKR